MAANINAGDLNRRIEIETPVATQDSNGDLVVEWEPVGTGEFWAAAEPDRGREYFEAAGIVAERPMLFRIRFFRGFTIGPLQRITYRGEIYNIYSAHDVNDGRQQTFIYARAGVNQG